MYPEQQTSCSILATALTNTFVTLTIPFLQCSISNHIEHMNRTSLASRPLTSAFIFPPLRPNVKAEAKGLLARLE